MNSEYLHKQLLTDRDRKRQEQEEKDRVIAREGLGKEEWWLKNVHSKEDVARFFEIYHPEFPAQLCAAFAEYFQQTVNANGDNLTEEQKLNFVRGYGKDQNGVEIQKKWDWRQEVKDIQASIVPAKNKDDDDDNKEVK